MRKYFEVFYLSFKMQIVWRFDVAMTMLATIGRIFAAVILWGAVFDGRDLVGGFTYHGMLSYYLLSSFLTSINMGSEISGEVSYLIREGGFSKHMVVPMNPLYFFSFMAAGESAFHLGFSLVAAAFCAIVFRIPLAIAADAPQVIAAVFMVILGLIFMICFHYLLGILSFKFLSIRAFMFIANHLIEFATGALVPLLLLPDGLIRGLRYLPFYYVTYLPSMLLIGRGGGEAVSGLCILGGWTIAAFLLIRFSYDRLRTRYDGVGI